eukprot:gene15449-20472_t
MVAIPELDGATGPIIFGGRTEQAAAAAKKAADEKKRNDPKLLEPARIWVQVAGGANDAALVLAWNTMKGRAEENGMTDIRTLPVLPLRDIVVFPHMVVPLFVGRDKSVRALEEVMRGDKQI